MTVTEITLVVGVVTTSIVTIINTVAASWGHRDVKQKLELAKTDRAEVKAKLDVVTENTNGALTTAKNRIIELEALVKALTLLVEKRGYPPSGGGSNSPLTNADIASGAGKVPGTS